jgi:hypothetical protein
MNLCETARNRPDIPAAPAAQQDMGATPCRRCRRGPRIWCDSSSAGPAVTLEPSYRLRSRLPLNPNSQCQDELVLTIRDRIMRWQRLERAFPPPTDRSGRKRPCRRIPSPSHERYCDFCCVRAVVAGSRPNSVNQCQNPISNLDPTLVKAVYRVDSALSAVDTRNCQLQWGSSPLSRRSI